LETVVALGLLVEPNSQWFHYGDVPPAFEPKWYRRHGPYVYRTVSDGKDTKGEVRWYINTMRYSQEIKTDLEAKLIASLALEEISMRYANQGESSQAVVPEIVEHLAQQLLAPVDCLSAARQVLLEAQSLFLVPREYMGSSLKLEVSSQPGKLGRDAELLPLSATVNSFLGELIDSNVLVGLDDQGHVTAKAEALCIVGVLLERANLLLQASLNLDHDELAEVDSSVLLSL
jgi:hypothetical protein